MIVGKGCGELKGFLNVRESIINHTVRKFTCQKSSREGKERLKWVR